MNRYADSPGVRDVLFRLELDPWGAAVILMGPREHEAVAAALEQKLPQATRMSAEQAGSMPPGGSPVLVMGLGPPGPQRNEALSRLNSRREWFSAHRQCVLLLVDPGEMMDLQRHAGDLWAAPNFRTTIPFLPDPEVDEAAARAELAANLSWKHGRLDLRGFVRAESEDVSFRVEDVFVETSAAARPLLLLDVEEAATAAQKPTLRWVEQAVREPRRPLVILGAPGAGKTFLLRWLALRAVHQTSLFGLSEPFPVLVSLAAFARAPLRPSLLDHAVFSLLAEGQRAGHVLLRKMQEGRVLFLFDGLDEIANDLDRKRIREGLADLRARAPLCPIVLTSRIAGYERDADLDPVEVTLLEFDDDAIQRFSTRWCELYAVDRKGDSAPIREEGRKEGERLASDILANPSVRQLAGTPLLLTVIAIVHRAGVRLPEHRVELYDHVTRVLVERWNRVRGAEVTDVPAPPLKSADAVRLLGPLALRMVRAGVRSTVSLEVLREELGKVLDKGPLKGLATVDEAIELFRVSLGLLVEQAPSVFAFLHFTIAEFFAALELARTGELEKVAANLEQASSPNLREVLLLGAGILGVLRAEDERLSVFVKNLLASADRIADPGSELPTLLVGLLADDPALTESQKEAIAETLIPKIWFDRWRTPEQLGAAAQTALLTMARFLIPILDGAAWVERLQSRAALVFGQEPVLPGLRVRPVHFGEGFLVVLEWLDFLGEVLLNVSFDRAIVHCLLDLSAPDIEALAAVGTPLISHDSTVMRRPDGRFGVHVRRAYDEVARSGRLPLAFRVGHIGRKPGAPTVDIPVAETEIERDEAKVRTVVFSLPPGTFPDGALLSAGIVLFGSAGAPSGA